MLGASKQNKPVSGQTSGQDDFARTQFNAQIKRICIAVGAILPSHLDDYLGVTHQAISVAKKRHAIPKSWLATLNRKYNISIDWILTGEGPMKMGQMRAMLEDASGQPSTTGGPRDRPSEMADQIKISEDLALAAEVLESKTAYAVALHLNIHQFARAVRESAKNQQLQDQLSAQAETIHQLQQESTSTRKEVEDLKSQLARLLATGGDPKPAEDVA